MAIDNKLFNAILSLDSYNRGDNQGISKLSSDFGFKLGFATIITDSRILRDDQDQRLDLPANFVEEIGRYKSISYKDLVGR